MLNWDYRIIHKNSYYWVQYGKFFLWFYIKMAPGPSAADMPIPYNTVEEAEECIKYYKEQRRKCKNLKSPKKVINYY